jgi:hypothetical protein
MNSGDKNTKYFHKVANNNRIKKHIWGIQKANGEIISEQENLKEAVVNYFKDFYKAQTNPITTEQCRLIDSFPQMINAEESDFFILPCHYG